MQIPSRLISDFKGIHSTCSGIESDKDDTVHFHRLCIVVREKDVSLPLSLLTSFLPVADKSLFVSLLPLGGGGLR